MKEHLIDYSSRLLKAFTIPFDDFKLIFGLLQNAFLCNPIMDHSEVIRDKFSNFDCVVRWPLEPFAAWKQIH